MQVVYAHSVLEPAISNLSFALVACILLLRHVASVSCALFGSNRTRRSTLRLRRLICCALEVEPIYHSLNATRTRALHSPPLSSRLARLVICSSPLIPFTLLLLCPLLCFVTWFVWLSLLLIREQNIASSSYVLKRRLAICLRTLRSALAVWCVHSVVCVVNLKWMFVSIALNLQLLNDQCCLCLPLCKMLLSCLCGPNAKRWQFDQSVNLTLWGRGTVAVFLKPSVRCPNHPPNRL